MKALAIRNNFLIFNKEFHRTSTRRFHNIISNNNNNPKRNESNFKNIEDNFLQVINFLAGCGMGLLVGLVLRKRVSKPIVKDEVIPFTECVSKCPMQKKVTLAPLLSNSSASVVTVRIMKNNTIQQEQSGFVVHHTGLILSVGVDSSKCDAVTIKTQDGRTFPVHIVEYDTSTGLCLLKILSQSPLFLPALNLSNDKDVYCRTGDFVVSLGASNNSNFNQFSFGILKTEYSGDSFTNNYLFSEITNQTCLLPGGPVINLQGKVIGINASDSYLEKSCQVVIPVELGRFLLERNKAETNDAVSRVPTCEENPSSFQCNDKLKSLIKETYFK